MKKLCLSVALIVLFISAATSQVRVGVKGGLSTFDIEANQLIILNQNDVERFKLDIDNANYGIHLGFFVQIKSNAFFLQPEILFNSNTVNYRFEDVQSADVKILGESYQQLDLPLILGFRAGPVRIGGGPVGHLPISSTSDLTNTDGYQQTFDKFTWGYQAGLGLDLWKLHVDVRYEGNFSNYGDHLVFFGDTYTFDDQPSRLIASLGISF